jgi:hypothetical protein
LNGEDLEILLKNCPKLYKLKLAKNLIEKIDVLKCLENYNIKKLYLEGNPFIEPALNYRELLFNMIPSLESIDHLNKEGNQIESTVYEDEGEEEEDDEELYDDEDDGELEDDEDDEDEDENDFGEEDEEDEEDDEKAHKRKK